MGESKEIPIEVSRITGALMGAGFEAYLIGGCVRDLLLGKKPKDWDVTTNATPDQIIALFPKTFYENTYGTVGVVTEDVSDETLKIVEVTPYRLESGYSDNRRPDSVVFSKKLEDDLKRRDFTINALAMSFMSGERKVSKGHIVDLYKGQEDIEKGIVRTVGNPDERFGEDALRMLRAVRLAAELGFAIEQKTLEGIVANASKLSSISKERIRDEFTKIIMSPRPMEALSIAHKIDILKYISPEFEKGIGIDQNQAHSFDVWEHLLRALQHAADKSFSLKIRLAALFHDIGKPDTRRHSPEKKDWTFYGHDVVGERITRRVLTELTFPKKLIDDVCKLVRWHMFFSDTDQITLSAVRRLVVNVGKDQIWDLVNLRMCDRIGTGRPKESPYRLRKYKSMIEEAIRDPISVGMLKIDGKGIMEATKLPPGPKIGFILHALLEEVLDDPKRNTTEYLEKKALELSTLDEETLRKMGAEGVEKKQEKEGEELKKIRDRHWVK